MLFGEEISNLIKKSDPSISVFNPLENDNKNKKRKISAHWNGFRQVIVNAIKQITSSEILVKLD